MSAKPRLAVFKMTSCDGCQLQLLDAEEALLAVASAVDIVYFREATSREDKGHYDVALVEGSISTAWQIEEILDVRSRSNFLVAIGACATTGGIQALRNLGKLEDFKAAVYPSPEYVSSLEASVPISDYVKVDLELPGCPVDRGQLLGTLAALLAGTIPRLSHAPVCVECKRRGYTCVVVAKGEPCLGPVTSTGCGALCPAYGRGCYGCFGPAEGLQAEAMKRLLEAQGLTQEQARRKFALINSWAPAFKQAAAGEGADR